MNKLLEALRPFVEFHDEGKAWTETAWESAGDDTDVLYDHKTGRSIKLGDFKRAARALREAER